MLIHTIWKGAIDTSAGTWVMIQFNFSFSKSSGAISGLTSERQDRQDLSTSLTDSPPIHFIYFNPTAVHLSLQT